MACAGRAVGGYTRDGVAVPAPGAPRPRRPACRARRSARPAVRSVVATWRWRRYPSFTAGPVSWQPWLEDRVLGQLPGLPPEAFDTLVQTLARICDDPYDPVFSTPGSARTGQARRRSGRLGVHRVHRR
jgi:hypothetical protein